SFRLKFTEKANEGLEMNETFKICTTSQWFHLLPSFGASSKIHFFFLGRSKKIKKTKTTKTKKKRMDEPDSNRRNYEKVRGITEMKSRNHGGSCGRGG